MCCLTAMDALSQVCQTRGLLGATLQVGNRAEGQMMSSDSKSTTSTGNGLGNVACGEVDLQKKGQYLSSISTPSPFFELEFDFRLTMPREGRRCGDAGEVLTFFSFFWGATSPLATLHRRLPGEVVIVSWAALKGSEGREFDTPALSNSLACLLIFAGIF